MKPQGKAAVKTGRQRKQPKLAHTPLRWIGVKYALTHPAGLGKPPSPSTGCRSQGRVSVSFLCGGALSGRVSRDTWPIGAISPGCAVSSAATTDSDDPSGCVFGLGIRKDGTGLPDRPNRSSTLLYLSVHCERRFSASLAATTPKPSQVYINFLSLTLLPMSFPSTTIQ